MPAGTTAPGFFGNGIMLAPMRGAVLLLIIGLIACGDDGSEARSVFESPAQRDRRETERSIELQRQRQLLEQLEAERKSGLRVDLPQGAAQEIDPTQASLVLDVGDDGTVGVAGKVIGDDELERVFRAAHARAQDTQVVIRASRSVAHGRVVQLMELAKAVGLTRLAIGTAPAPPGDP
jgi:biopolymer transport protein ExbD